MADDVINDAFRDDFAAAIGWAGGGGGGGGVVRWPRPGVPANQDQVGRGHGPGHGVRQADEADIEPRRLLRAPSSPPDKTGVWVKNIWPTTCTACATAASPR